MSAADFDAWSEDYERALDEALSVTGFDATHFVRYKLATLKRILPRFTGRPFELLDYGCGPANLCAHLHETFPQARYTGVDPSRKMIEHARKRFARDAELYALDDHGWKRRHYDLVLAAGVFHHIPHAEHAAVIRDLVARLAPGGVLVIWEHNSRNPFTRKIVRDCAFDRGAVLVPPRQLRGLLAASGLEHVATTYVTFFPRALRWLIPLEHCLGWLPLGGQYVVLGECRQR